MTVIFWIALSVLIGALASGKNRSGIGWFLLSCLLSPLISAIALAIAGEKK
ncbi:MAG: hypothetical protein WBA93_30975 [Microcoleaceae cyanobacterium]